MNHRMPADHAGIVSRIRNHNVTALGSALSAPIDSHQAFSHFASGNGVGLGLSALSHTVYSPERCVEKGCN